MKSKSAILSIVVVVLFSIFVFILAYSNDNIGMMAIPFIAISNKKHFSILKKCFDKNIEMTIPLTNNFNCQWKYEWRMKKKAENEIENETGLKMDEIWNIISMYSVNILDVYYEDTKLVYGKHVLISADFGGGFSTEFATSEQRKWAREYPPFIEYLLENPDEKIPQEMWDDFEIEFYITFPGNDFPYCCEQPNMVVLIEQPSIILSYDGSEYVQVLKDIISLDNE